MEPTGRGGVDLGTLLADLTRLLAEADVLCRQIAARLAIVRESRPDEPEAGDLRRAAQHQRLNGKAS